MLQKSIRRATLFIAIFYLEGRGKLVVWRQNILHPSASDVQRETDDGRKTGYQYLSEVLLTRTHAYENPYGVKY